MNNICAPFLKNFWGNEAADYLQFVTLHSRKNVGFIFYIQSDSVFRDTDFVANTFEFSQNLQAKPV